MTTHSDKARTIAHESGISVRLAYRRLRNIEVSAENENFDYEAETHKETIETDRRCQALNILYIRHIKNELPVKSDSPIKIECVTCVRN